MVYALSHLKWHFLFNSSSPIKVAEKYPPIKYRARNGNKITLDLMTEQLLCKQNEYGGIFLATTFQFGERIVNILECKRSSCFNGCCYGKIRDIHIKSMAKSPSFPLKTVFVSLWSEFFFHWILPHFHPCTFTWHFDLLILSIWTNK